MDSGRKWSPMACPVCGSRSLSFIEVRETLKHYRSRTAAPTGTDRAAAARGFKDSLCEQDSRTSYVSDIQARCDECGLAWVLPGIRRIEDLESLEPTRPAAKSRRRTIRTADLLEAIRSGSSDTHVISKFDLSARQLEVILQQLVARGLLSEKEIDRRLGLADTAITKAFDDTRRSIQELQPDTRSRPNVATPAPEHPKPLGTCLEVSGARVISVNSFIADVKQGVSDSYLMNKYSLNKKQLEFMFQRLVESGRVTLPELYERTSVYGSSITKAFVEVYESLRELDEQTCTLMTSSE